MVISIPSVRNDPAHEIILHRMPVDYEGAETIQEKEMIYEKMKAWLMSMYCREIWMIGKEPLIYVETESKMNDWPEEELMEE